MSRNEIRGRLQLVFRVSVLLSSLVSLSLLEIFRIYNKIQLKFDVDESDDDKNSLHIKIGFNGENNQIYFHLKYCVKKFSRFIGQVQSEFWQDRVRASPLDFCRTCTSGFMLLKTKQKMRWFSLFSVEIQEQWV